MMKKIVVLYSGGLDSYVMYNMAKKENPDSEIVAIYWDHGMPVAKMEISKLPSFVKVKNVDWIEPNNGPRVQPGRESNGAVMIPGRNLVFCTLIACQELPDEIWLGTLAGETHSKATDKNETFVKLFQDAVNYAIGPFMNGRKVSVKLPLVEHGLNKVELVKWALGNGMSKDELINTHSCYSDTVERCGNCVPCAKRWAAFGMNGFSEQYNVPLLEQPFIINFLYENLRAYCGLTTEFSRESTEEVVPYMIETYKNTPNVFDEKTRTLLSTLV